MKVLLLILLALLQPAARAGASDKSPFVCNLGVLTAADRARKEDVSLALAARLTQIRELPDGFEFQFTAEATTLPLIGEWTSTERLCCPFFDFTVPSEREGGP